MVRCVFSVTLMNVLMILTSDTNAIHTASRENGVMTVKLVIPNANPVLALMSTTVYRVMMLTLICTIQVVDV